MGATGRWLRGMVARSVVAVALVLLADLVGVELGFRLGLRLRLGSWFRLGLGEGLGLGPIGLGARGGVSRGEASRYVCLSSGRLESIFYGGEPQ